MVNALCTVFRRCFASHLFMFMILVIVFANLLASSVVKKSAFCVFLFVVDSLYGVRIDSS